MSKASLMTWAAVLTPLLAAGPATRPATRPAAKAASQPASRPVGGLSVGKGLVEFVAPSAEWTVHPTEHPSPDVVVLVHGTEADGEIQVKLGAKDFELSPDTNAQMRTEMAKALKALRVKNEQEMLTPPTAVKDKRFDIAIHERFRVKGDVVEDEMHLFKSVGSRTVEVTVATVSEDPKAVKKTFEDGEAVLAGATYNRKAFKK